MARIERCEDVRAWQMARKWTNLLYDLTDRGEFAPDFKLRVRFGKRRVRS